MLADRLQYLLYAGFCTVGLAAGLALLLLLGGKGGPDQRAGYSTAAPGDAVTFEEFLGNMSLNTNKLLQQYNTMQLQTT